MFTEVEESVDYSSADSTTTPEDLEFPKKVEIIEKVHEHATQGVKEVDLNLYLAEPQKKDNSTGDDMVGVKSDTSQIFEDTTRKEATQQWKKPVENTETEILKNAHVEMVQGREETNSELESKESNLHSAVHVTSKEEVIELSVAKEKQLFPENVSDIQINVESITKPVTSLTVNYDDLNFSKRAIIIKEETTDTSKTLLEKKSVQKLKDFSQDTENPLKLETSYPDQNSDRNVPLPFKSSETVFDQEVKNVRKVQDLNEITELEPIKAESLLESLKPSEYLEYSIGCDNKAEDSNDRITVAEQERDINQVDGDDTSEGGSNAVQPDIQESGQNVKEDINTEPVQTQVHAMPNKEHLLYVCEAVPLVCESKEDLENDLSETAFVKCGRNTMKVSSTHRQKQTDLSEDIILILRNS
ncbi:uncharacterized protein LOC143226905 [Tachypleus tridentatus]|uniref:uncharacterized protein LOC143226905 n=1 Tax=Tachypleus tridentatus TaxID=6853 RepID=UPI003FD11EAA